MVEEIDDKQKNNEKLREQIKKRVKFEEIAHYTVEALVLATYVSELELIESCQHISPEQYDDVVEERAISKYCGYPICNCKPMELKKQYHISLKDACVYDITKRKNFCSNHCYEASDYLRNQISSTPVWVRESFPKVIFKLLDRSHIKGQIGELVFEDSRKVLERELLINESNNSASLDSTYDENEHILTNILPINSDQDLHKKIMHLLKNKKTNMKPYFENIYIHTNENAISDKLIGKISDSKLVNIDNKLVKPNDGFENILDNEGNSNSSLLNNHQVLNKVLIKDNFSNVDYKSKYLDSDDDDFLLIKPDQKLPYYSDNTICDDNLNIDCINIQLANNTIKSSNQTGDLDDEMNKLVFNISNSSTNSNQIKLDRVRDKISCRNSKKSILISQSIFKNAANKNELENSDLNFSNDKKDHMYKESLIINPLKQFLAEWLNFNRKKNKSKIEGKDNIGCAEKPNENYIYACKVRQFFENTENEKDSEDQIILPNVDSHSQINIRRQLVYKNIYNSLRFLSKMYGMDKNIMSNIKDIVCHFRFSSQNILLNPNQWNTVTLIFIKYLVESKKVQLDDCEFKRNLNNYLEKINIPEKQFNELYSLYIDAN